MITDADRHQHERRTWSALGAVTQAALRCKEPVFWAFLNETFAYHHSVGSGFIITKIEDEETAAKVVRGICEVESRRELAGLSNSQAIWHDLDNLYQAWRARER